LREYGLLFGVYRVLFTFAGALFIASEKGRRSETNKLFILICRERRGGAGVSSIKEGIYFAWGMG